MATPNPLGNKPDFQPKRKRLVQPVLPLLPQIPVRKKKHEAAGVQSDCVGNKRKGQASELGSEQAWVQDTHSLQNGVYEDRKQEITGLGQPSEIAASSATSITELESETISADLPLESAVTVTALAQQATPATTSPSSAPDVAAKAAESSSEQSDFAGLDFPHNLSELRTSRTPDHKFMFHATAESSSPSRTTQRSMSDAPNPTPPPDLSHIRLASTAPESVTTQYQNNLELPPRQSVTHDTEAAELPNIMESNALYESQTRRSVAKPDLIDGSPQSRSALDTLETSGSQGNFDVFQSDVIKPDFAQSLPSPYTIQPPSMEIPAWLADRPEIQETHVNGTNDAQSPVPRAETDSLPNAHQAATHFNGVRPAVNGYRPPPPDSEEVSMTTISEHFSRLFLSREWVDWSIEVTSPVKGFSPIGYHAHGVVIARCPALRQKMRQQLLSNRVDHVIIVSPDRYIQPPAFEAALRFLYTEQLLTRSEVEETFVTGGSDAQKLSREYQFDCALSYWMAGSILGLRAVADQGKKLIVHMLNWDVLEIAFQQALILEERSTKFAAELASETPNTPKSSTPLSAASPWKSTESSSSEHYTSATSGAAPMFYQYPVINETISRSLKRIVYDFISERLDVSTFDVENPATTILRSYLPQTHEYSNNSRHTPNPALSAIRFGAMPLVDEEIVPVPTQPAIPRTSGQITSAVILNLTFPDLYDLCQTFKEYQITIEQTGKGAQLYDWVQQVIGERESRRRKVIESKTVLNQERQSKDQTWHIVGWEEHVQVSNERVGGWELGRTWKGFAIPGRQ